MKQAGSSNRLLETLVTVWAGSLGFVVGATLAALVGKLLGWWPVSETRLRKYLQSRDDR